MKNKLLLTLISILSIAKAKADNDAIYVWVDGQSTCYQLESQPKVTYGSDGTNTTVVLTFGDESIPVLTLPLVDKTSQLRIVYGQYDASTDPTEIELVSASPDTKVVCNGKFISGGRLVIIKNGKQYDIKGHQIK